MEAIRAARTALKMNQTEFGQAIGVSQGMVSKLEAGTIETLDIGIAARIVQACTDRGVHRTLDDFVPGGTGSTAAVTSDFIPGNLTAPTTLRDHVAEIEELAESQRDQLKVEAVPAGPDGSDEEAA